MMDRARVTLRVKPGTDGARPAPWGAQLYELIDVQGWIDPEAFPGLAIHPARRADGYALTHLGTGLCLPLTLPTIEDAARVAAMLCAHFTFRGATHEELAAANGPSWQAKCLQMLDTLSRQLWDAEKVRRAVLTVILSPRTRTAGGAMAGPRPQLFRS